MRRRCRLRRTSTVRQRSKAARAEVRPFQSIGNSDCRVMIHWTSPPPENFDRSWGSAREAARIASFVPPAIEPSVEPAERRDCRYRPGAAAPSAPERKRRPVRPALAAGALRRCAAATLRSGGLGVSRGRRRQPALPMSVTPLHARPSANSSGRDQRQTVDSGSTSRKSSSVQTSAVSSNSDTKVSASGPATR